MFNSPLPDESAYSGDIIVKSKTYGKSKVIKSSGVDKVKQSINCLEEEVDKLLTIDKLDPNSDISIKNQLIINKELCRLLRKEVTKLKVFIKNS